MGCSLPGSSVHGIFQVIVLEWIAISFSRGSSQSRDWTWVSRIVDRHFTVWATKADKYTWPARRISLPVILYERTPAPDTKSFVGGVHWQSPAHTRECAWQGDWEIAYQVFSDSIKVGGFHIFCILIRLRVRALNWIGSSKDSCSPGTTECDFTWNSDFADIKEKGVTEDEIVGRHHQLNGHEFEQILGDTEG